MYFKRKAYDRLLEWKAKYSDKYAAVVVDSTSGSPYRLDVYNTDGKKVTSIDFDYAYTGVLIDGDRLILYNEESCRVYNLDGHEKFNGQFDYSVSLVRAGKIVPIL